MEPPKDLHFCWCHFISRKLSYLWKKVIDKCFFLDNTNSFFRRPGKCEFFIYFPSIPIVCIESTIKNAGSEFFVLILPSPASFYHTYPVLKHRYNRNESNTFQFFENRSDGLQDRRENQSDPTPLAITPGGHPGTGQ